MVSLTALAGGNLYLFYSKGDKRIYYRLFNGTAWGAESLLQDVSATNLRGALAPMESAINCSVGLAFMEGTASPFNVRFTLGVGSCGSLTTSQGAGTVTVAGPGSFEMTFDQLRGGSLDELLRPGRGSRRAFDLAGKPSVNVYGLFHAGTTQRRDAVRHGYEQHGCQAGSAGSDADPSAGAPGGLLPESSARPCCPG